MISTQLHNTQESKKDDSYFSKLLQFSLNFIIQFEKQYINYSLSLQLLIEGVIYCQVMSLYLSQVEQINGIDNKMLRTLYLIVNITRPYQYLKEIHNFYQYSCLLPLIWMTIIILGILVHFVVFQIKKLELNQILQITLELNNLSKSLVYFIVGTFTIYEKMLFFIWFECAIEQFLIKSSSNTSMVFVVLGILTFILILAVHLYIKIFFQTSIFNLNLQRFNHSLLVYVDNFLIVFIITLKSVNSSDYFIFSEILIVLFCLNRTIMTFTLYDTLYEIQRVSLAFQCLIYLLIAVLIQSLDNQNKSYDDRSLLVLLLFPISWFILLNFHQQIYNITMSQFNQDCDKQLFKIISLIQLINQQKYNVSAMIQFYVYQNQQDAQENPILLQKTQFQELLIIQIQQDNQFFYENILKLRDQHSKLHFYLWCIQFNQQIIKLQRKDISKEMLKQKSLITTIFRKVTNDNYTENFSSEIQSKVQKKREQNTESILFKEIKFQNLSMIQQQKLNMVLSHIKKQLMQDIQSKEHDNLSFGVQLFLQSEIVNIKLNKKIQKAIKLKRDILTSILETGRRQKFLFAGLKLSMKLQKIEKYLNEQYVKFPSQKMQTMLIFFYSEIMNNYLKAYKIQNLTTISDEQLLKLHSMTEFDFFSNKLQYIIVNIDQIDMKLRITQKSQDLHQIVQISKQQIQNMNLVDQFLPRGFERIHKHLIHQFLQKGSSKYYKQINLNYIQTGNKFLRQINFFFDNNFINLNELSFIGFFQELSIQDSIIFVGSNGKILGISKNLAPKFGIQSKYCDKFRSSLIRQNITKFITNFNGLVDKNLEINLFANDQDQFFVYQNQFKLNHKNYYSDDQYDVSNLTRQTYLVDMIIHSRSFSEDLSYFIIEIKNTKLLTIIEENQDIPTESPADNANKRKSQQIEIKKTLIFNQDLQLNQQDEGVITLRSRNDDYQINDKLMSSEIPAQQVYYNKQMSQRSSDQLNSAENDEQQEDEKQLAILNQYEVDQEFKENEFFNLNNYDSKQNENIVHIDDIGSQVESVAGLRQSRYFKKYEFIDRFINYGKVPISINLYVLSLLIMISIGLVQSILFIINSNQDLDRFLLEIDMIQIQANFIGPLDKYIVCLNCNTNAVLLYVLFQQLSIIELGQRTAYSSYMINKTYYELKYSFDEQLTNPYVTPFLNDKYVSVYQIQAPPNVTIRNSTIIESLNLLLEASYRFKLLKAEEILTLDLMQGYLAYLLKNYLVFKKLFKQLNTDMLDYSVYRSSQVYDKWLAIQLPCYLLCFVSLSLGFIYFSKYVKNQLKIKYLFEISNSETFRTELDKLNLLLKIIKQDEKIISQYQFDLDTKEKQLVAEDLKKDQKKQENSAKRLTPAKLQLVDNFQQKSLSINFIILIIIYGFYLTFMIISQINGQKYFKQYPQTAQYFNSLSDITIASSGVHSQHIFTYQTSMGSFPYITAQETESYLNYFNENIDIINKFLIMSSQLESLNLYITDEYLQIANKIMNSDVCVIQARYDLISNFCDVSYGGAFRRGFYTGITAVRDSLLNEKVITYNFTYYDYSNKEITLEGGLISTEAIYLLKQKFLNILIDLTNNLSSFIQLMSIMYIILSFVITIIIIQGLRKYYKRQFQLTLRLILLIPLKSLLLDSQVERELRQFATQQQII